MCARPDGEIKIRTQPEAEERQELQGPDCRFPAYPVCRYIEIDQGGDNEKRRQMVCEAEPEEKRSGEEVSRNLLILAATLFYSFKKEETAQYYQQEMQPVDLNSN